MTIVAAIWLGGFIALALKGMASGYLSEVAGGDLVWFVVYDLFWPISLIVACVVDRDPS